MVLRRVVVTGLGALHPLEITLKNIELLINGVCAAPITYFDAQNLKLICMRTKNFNAEDFFRKEARKMDRYTYAMVSSEEQ
jgi:3-oxoacyl-(acyl-carrier-protein) synthase